MRTISAIILYWVAIIVLVLCAVGVVFRLVIWPPCVPIKDACVVDGWSVAGLAGTVLAVAATMLAILGAVAVAYWWLSLNDRVTKRVNKLYAKQEAAITARVDTLLSNQQQKVDDQFLMVQTKLQEAESRISQATKGIDELEALTRDFLDIALDGIVLTSVKAPEEWARKVAALHKFPKVPLMMATRYLKLVGKNLVDAEEGVRVGIDRLTRVYEEYKQKTVGNTPSETSEANPISREAVAYVFDDVDLKLYKARETLDNWTHLLYWREVASVENADPTALQELIEKISKYQPRITQLQISLEQFGELRKLAARSLTKTISIRNIEKDNTDTT